MFAARAKRHPTAQGRSALFAKADPLVSCASAGPANNGQKKPLTLITRIVPS